MKLRATKLTLHIPAWANGVLSLLIMVQAVLLALGLFSVIPSALALQLATLIGFWLFAVGFWLCDITYIDGDEPEVK